MSGHGPHADPKDPFQKTVAVMLASFAALLAFMTMLTNEARTESLLKAQEATNKWSYFQSKSTKGVVTHATFEILSHQASPDEVVLAKLTKDAERYDKEKGEIEAEAREIVAEQKYEEHKEHFYEYAATLTELAIVISSLALLFGSRRVLVFGVVGAVASLGLAAYTAFFLPVHGAEHEADAHGGNVTTVSAPHEAGGHAQEAAHAPEAPHAEGATAADSVK